MKKITKLKLMLLPLGAMLISACGPEGMMESELGLDGASDPWVVYNGVTSEWGECKDIQDNDGDGLIDANDPDCAVIGPVRDLSFLGYGLGHNFLPDVSKIIPGGPAWGGDFADPALYVRWFRFLTGIDGYTAGIDLVGPGADPLSAPIPALLPEKPLTGTWHQGNNNNVNVRDLHAWHMVHPVLPAVNGATTGVPSAGPLFGAHRGYSMTGPMGGQGIKKLFDERNNNGNGNQQDHMPIKEYRE